MSEPEASQQSAPAEPGLDAADESQAEAPGAGGETRVVFLEADPAERERLGALREALGCPVTVLGPDAITPDVLGTFADARAVVVDFELGGRPGLDLVEHLTRHEATRHLPVAVAAAAPTRPRVAAALRAGARTVLAKPVEPEELRERVLAPDPQADADS